MRESYACFVINLPGIRPMSTSEPAPALPPRKRRSSRRLLLELFIVTAGVLIALLIQSLVDWNHYRMLVRDARGTITMEMTSSRDELRGFLNKREERSAHLNNALTFADDLLAKRATSVSSISIGFNFPDLGSSAWRTAEQTGALAHMAFEDVQRYAQVYALQELLQEQMRRTIEQVSGAIAIVGRAAEPGRTSPDDLRLFRQRVLELLGQVILTNQLADGLMRRYDEALTR
jgi:hypothetical protein